MKYENVPIVDDKDNHSFEMVVDGLRSFIDYRIKGDKIYLVHTEVPPELEGEGLAAAMVEKALQHIESQRLKLIPLCAYVQFFLKRHPEWNRLVDENF